MQVSRLIITVLAAGALGGCDNSPGKTPPVLVDDLASAPRITDAGHGDRSELEQVAGGPAGQVPSQTIAPGFPKQADPAQAELDHVGLGVIDLKGRVAYDGEHLALPTLLVTVGEYLVGVDNRADTLLYVLDRQSGQLLRSFGRRGEGPGEFRSIYSLDPIAGSNSRLWAYDVQLRRLTLVDVEAAGSGPEHYAIRVLPLQVTSTIAATAWVGDSIASTGFFPAGRITYLDSNGVAIGTAGTLPPGDSRTPANVRQHAYQGLLVVRPDRSRMAVLTRHLGQVEIFASAGELLRTVTGPYLFEPRYRVVRSSGENVMGTDTDLRFGYIAAAATDRVFVGLFSGRTRAGFPDAATFGTFVHVFDWDGNLLRVLRLDHAGIGMALDEHEEVLYVVVHDPAPSILRYELSGLIM